MKYILLLFTLSVVFVQNISGQSFVKGTTISNTNFANGASLWGDYDNDGDLDLILMGTPSNISSTKVYTNNADGTFSENLNHNFVNLGDGDLDWEDYNNDGNLDLLVSGLDNTGGGSGVPVTKIYKNIGNGSFQDLNKNFTNVYQGSVSWVDFNNDGKADFFVSGREHPDGTGNTSGFYKNLGEDQFELIQVPFENLSQSDIDWADFDNDGYLDAAIAGFTGLVGLTKIYRNLGDETFEFHQQLTTAMRASVDWGDYNNDGQIDLVVSGFSGSEQTLVVYKNNSGSFQEVNDVDFAGGEQGATHWIDYDNDGNLDIISSVIGDGVWATRLYHNEGNDDFTLDSNSGLPTDFSNISLVDIDMDGDLDIFFPSTFNSDNATSFYVNSSGTSNISPDIPVLNKEQIDETSITFSWEVSSDSETSESVTYNIFITHDGDTIIAPNSVLNGTRKVPKRGNRQFQRNYILSNYKPGDYTYSVQAVDNGFNASAFAAINSFHINFPPTITALIESISSDEDTPLAISIDQFSIDDPDNAFPGDFSITLHAGENYTISGDEIIPETNFNGTLTISVSVNDGEDESEIFQFPAEILPVNDIPVITGTENPLSTPEGTALSINITDLTIEDPDNTFPDNFILTIGEGENYSVNGNTLTPHEGFIGTLSVSLVASDGIDDSEPFIANIEVTIIISIESDHSKSFNIYPNPASNIINISTKKTPKSVTLIDMVGRQVGSLVEVIDHQNGLITVPIGSLKRGSYYLIIETESGQRGMKVIIE